MSAYKAFELLRKTLIDFFYEEGDILPFDQPGGVNNLLNLLNAFKDEVDHIPLLHDEAIISRYLLDLEDRASMLNSIFDDLFMGMLFLPEVTQIRNQVPPHVSGHISGQDVHAAICSRLFSDSIALERDWTGGTTELPEQTASTAFFASLSTWQKLAMRYKVVHNVILNISSHITIKGNRWKKPQIDINSNPVGKYLNADTRPNLAKDDLTGLLSIEWKLSFNKLAQLLYKAHVVKRVDLQALVDKKVLLRAMRKLCTSISFTTSASLDPGKSIYNVLIDLLKKPQRTVRNDSNPKSLPEFESIIELVKHL